MKGFINSLLAMDADDLFSYSTLKLVRIRDRRLGLLYYAFLLAIIFYIVFYNLLLEKKYMTTDIPDGSFRFTLRRPDKPLQLSELPYCKQTAPEINGFPNHHCVYYDDDLVVYPKTEESALLAATRITSQNMTVNCDYSEPECEATNITHPKTIYVADIEHFTLMIDHSIYSATLGIQRTGRNIIGKLVDINGKEMKLSAPNRIAKKNMLDIFQLGVLLEASGTKSLDILDEDHQGETLRYAGTILMIIVDYTNQATFNPSHFEYTISVRRVEGAEFKAEEYQYQEFPSKYSHWSRHGIRLLFLRRGTIGQFDFQTMLINIIAGSALMGVCTLVVDILAKFILPENGVYKAYMVQTTADFSDLRDNPELLAKFAEGKLPPEVLLNPNAVKMLEGLDDKKNQ